MHIAVLVTCHNRVDITIRGLSSLVYALQKVEDLSYALHVVDDGSSDGTAQEIARIFPEAQLCVGNGSLFWNRGMCRAYDVARKSGNFSDYLLFNDDVVVMPDAACSFFAEYRALNAIRPAILVGATLNEDGTCSYSAYLRPSSLRPLNLTKMSISGRVQPCDTFNGNFVMVPGPFFEHVGGLDPYYVHNYGDIDLGFVALRNGVQPYLASVPIGDCQANESNLQDGSTWATLLRGSWGKRDSLDQRMHFLRKHSSIAAQTISLPVVAMRYLLDWLARRFGLH